MIKQIKKWSSATVLAVAFKLIYSKPKPFFLTMLFDLLFIFALFSAGWLMGKITLFFAGISQFLVFLISIADILVIILLYSFFKYCVLDALNSFAKETKFSFKDVLDFFYVNLCLGAVLAIINLTVTLLLPHIFKQQYKVYILGIISFIFLFFLYVFVNLTHSYYAQLKEFKKTFESSFSAFFNAGSYAPMLFSLVVFVIVMGIMILLTLLLDVSIDKVKMMSFAYPIAFLIFLVIAAMSYILFVFNRVYFFEIARKSAK